MQLNRTSLSRTEFVILMSLIVALDALAIDSMLPALSHISQDLQIQHNNDRQFIITSIFIGYALGVIFYGILSDSIGRKKPVCIGFLLFLTGTIIAMLAESFAILLFGRFLQGAGAAGPHVIAIAIIRDQYSGRSMAQIMSLVMMIFILIPAIAPLLGQFILLFSHWRSIFLMLAIYAFISLAWFIWRQPETLPKAKRSPITLQHIRHSSKTVLTNRQCVVYTLLEGFLFAAFLAFLSTSQQVFQIQYSLGSEFPLYFASLSLVLGLAAFLNARWVTQLGMRRLLHYALIATTLSSLLYFIYVENVAHASLTSYLLYMGLTYFCFGIIFGNAHSLAMEPMGHIAGFAAALIGTITTLMASTLAALIGGQYTQNNTIPIILGFGCMSLIGLFLMRLEKRNINN